MKQQVVLDHTVESSSRKSLLSQTPEDRDSSNKKTPQWAVIHKVRLPHKVGLPLGSGDGGDDGGG